MKNQTVEVIIVVYKPDEKFHKLMQMLRRQTYPISCIRLMNTEEAYFPKGKYAGEPGIELTHLSSREFDHGGTRHRAACMSGGDILIFMTQDAVPQDEYLVESLVEKFEDSRVAAAYARQLPCPDCSVIERYTRSFNYGDSGMVKSLQDLKRLGIKTFFCSNVCAAYRRKDYFELGGFERHTIFNEDMIFAGRLVLAGKSIAYAADAKVIHSHNYSGVKQFKRNFDLAVSQADHPEIFSLVKSEDEGIRMVKKTAGYLLKIKKPWLLPELVMKSGFKYLGYRMGKRYQKLPEWLILKCTMNRNYWINKNN